MCTTIHSWEYSLGTHSWIFMVWVLQAFFSPCPPSLWLVGGIALCEKPAALLSWQRFHRVSKSPFSAVIKGFCLSCEICPVNADTD